MIAGLVRFSIRYAGVVVALAATIVAYGAYTLSRANLDVFPEFSPSQVVLQIEAPGLSSEQVEVLVTQPIENALAGVPGLDGIRSQSIPGLSVITVIFEDGSDTYRNRQVVSERLSALAAQMPEGVDAPTMTPHIFGQYCARHRRYFRSAFADAVAHARRLDDSSTPARSSRCGRGECVWWRRSPMANPDRPDANGSGGSLT